MDNPHEMKIWYDQPALQWEEALPVGNGRLGAMVFGNTNVDTMILNEDSVWYGGQIDRCSKDGHKHLAKLRELIRNGHQVEAEKLAELAFFSSPLGQRHYEPLANCTIEFGHHLEKVTNYHRELDLSNASVRISYQLNNVIYTRSTFASFPDEVLATKLTSSVPEKLSFTVYLDRMNHDPMDYNSYHDGVTSFTNENTLVLHLTPGGVGSNCAATAIKVIVDKSATVEFINNHIVVCNAQTAWVLCAAHSTFRTEDPAQECLNTFEACTKIGLDNLWKRHYEDYSSNFNTLSMSLGKSNDQTRLSTDKRLAAFQESSHDYHSLDDPGLLALYYQYGRYLLLSSSRNGPIRPLPANLQGIWGTLMQPAWGARFTTNINLQMNYWLVNAGNLSSCELPLFDILERLADRGKDVAQSLYGCRGWCVHSNTDIWADCAPVDKWMPATLWTLGGPWLCLHVWEHYLFNGDRHILERMYDIYKESVQFYLDFLVESQDGHYVVTSPSLSPENTFVLKNGTQGHLCEGSTIDIQILHAFFAAFLEISTILDKSCLVSETQKTLNKLPPMQIGSHGQLLEWQEEYEEAEPGHRHTSHLWGLYPGNLISPNTTPEFAEAAKVTLHTRTQHGGGHTGWSRAWMINLWARLLDGNEALFHINSLLGHSTMPNLLDIHPPFQIDGNFGGAAGIIELFIQSHDGVIRLLPALPDVSSLEDGAINGVCARGGFEIRFTWTGKKVDLPIKVKSRAGNKCVIQLQSCKVYREDGTEVPHSQKEDVIYFDTAIDTTYVIR